MGKPMNVSISLYGLLGDKIIGSAFGRLVENPGCFRHHRRCKYRPWGLALSASIAGIKHIFGAGLSTGGQMVFMAFLIIAYVISAISGIDKGIKNLSTANVIIAFCWGLFILFSGPTIELLNITVQTAGSYLSNFCPAQLLDRCHGQQGAVAWLVDGLLLDLVDLLGSLLRRFCGPYLQGPYPS